MDVPTRPERSITDADQRPTRHQIMIEVVILSIAALVYVLVRELTEGSPERAIANAEALLAFEQRLGIDHEHTLVALSIEHDWLRTFANWVYIWGHWPVIICVSTWLFVHHRERYLWLRNAVIASGMIGFAFFALVPMAPPRLSGLGYVDTITTWSNSYRIMQPPDYANLYAAMPSLHFGWDLLVGIALFTSTTVLALRVFACVMPTLMAFAVVATANHWILDVFVGLGVVSAGVVVSELLAARARTRDARARDPARAPATVRELN
jgi:hypothetical protein